MFAISKQTNSALNAALNSVDYLDLLIFGSPSPARGQILDQRLIKIDIF